MGLILFACLLSGPKARWVKRFLPNTANRVVFVIIVGALILALGLQGYKTFTGGTLEGGYFPFVEALLCAVALYRFIVEWWLRSPVSGAQDRRRHAATEDLPPET
jgi:hypothetical protein